MFKVYRFMCLYIHTCETITTVKFDIYMCVQACVCMCQTRSFLLLLCDPFLLSLLASPPTTGSHCPAFHHWRLVFSKILHNGVIQYVLTFICLPSLSIIICMLCVPILCSFLFLHSIPSYGSTTIHLFIHFVIHLSANHWKNVGDKPWSWAPHLNSGRCVHTISSSQRSFLDIYEGP